MVIIKMSNGQSENNGRRANSDDSSDDAGLYYYVYGSDHEDNGNHYGQDDHDDDNEVVIDFDSGESSAYVDLGTTYYSWGTYVDGQTGVYEEDGFTLSWYTYDFYTGVDGSASDDLGVAIFDAGNSNSDHADDHADDFAFGVNYINGNNNLSDGFEYSFGLLAANDEGGVFSLEDLDIIDTDSSTNPENIDAVQIGFSAFGPDGEIYQYATTHDTQTWDYSYATYEYATGIYEETITSYDSLDDLLDTGVFDGLSHLDMITFGDMAIDNIELDDIGIA